MGTDARRALTTLRGHGVHGSSPQATASRAVQVCVTAASFRWRPDNGFCRRPRLLWTGVLAALLVLVSLEAESQGGETSPADAERLRQPALDMRGLRRDTAYFVGYQFAAVAVISLWPREDTNYDESKDVGWKSWVHNVTHPQWDDDRAVVNYVLHPYWGAAYYVRARERSVDRTGAFWYSALLSTLFEFGAEAMVENVSYQDLLVTPLLGSLLGEHFFWPMRQRILAKSEALDSMDRITLTLTDPLGAINSSLDRLFNVEAQVALLTPLDPPEVRSSLCPAALAHCAPTIRPVSGGRRWGLQLRLRW